MGLDKIELEGIATAFYLRHGLDPSRPTDTFRLARKELGPGLHALSRRVEPGAADAGQLLAAP